VIIVTQAEAEAAEKKRATDTKTWHFKAKNVRDFAFASSRKFIWDAQGIKSGDTDVMAMSYYPKEGNPLWEKYSTQAVGPHHRAVQQVLLRLSVPDRDFRERPGGRHGIPDDLVQRPASDQGQEDRRTDLRRSAPSTA
jgi:hypothetical protein